jgi:hypothetical protein
MGEAKRKRKSAGPTVYHHTSSLRTNLIWMSGVIQVEGTSERPLHPQLGEIKTDALARRPLNEFPAVAWFTTRIDIPKCLVLSTLSLIDQETDEKETIGIGRAMANAIALNRVALGFRVADIPVVPWPDYYGYTTAEGQELNASARAAGDDPDEWYISETPVDVLRISEFWFSKSVQEPKLTRYDRYIEDIHRMVTFCRENKRARIPPSWLEPEQVEALARRRGLKIKGPA